MVEYEALKPLYEYLRVENMPKKHWSGAYGWEIGKHIHLRVLKALKVVVTSAKYFSITYDEVISIDNQQWLYVHIYVVDAFPCCYVLCRWSMSPMVII
jgi:hypothetical protein